MLRRTITDLVRKSLLVAVSIALLTAQCPSKVAPTTLQKLTTGADLIVIGKVTRLLDVNGVHVAELQVDTTLKGPPYSRVYYLAQPTWICDISGGTIGQETLFFFKQYVFDPRPASMAFVERSRDSEQYLVRSGTISVGGFFKEPPGFRQKVQMLAGNTPFFVVYWSGRGQMPVRRMRGNKYVTLWVGDVRLPADIPTINGPDAKYGSFIRSAPLSAITLFVRRYAKSSVGGSLTTSGNPQKRD